MYEKRIRVPYAGESDTITCRVSRLEAEFVPRREFEVIPPHVEYSLTELGRALTPAIDSLGEWGHQVWLANGSPEQPE